MTTQRQPDFIGQAGKAWKLDLPAVIEKHKLNPANVGCIAYYTIHAPFSHPLWQWYRLSLVHLRPLPALTEPLKLYLEGATHEMVLEALDPNHYPPNVDSFMQPYLKPTNFAAQLVCESDEAAIKRIEDGAVKAIVHGLLSPDTDYQRYWAQAFGDNMIKRTA